MTDRDLDRKLTAMQDLAEGDLLKRALEPGLHAAPPIDPRDAEILQLRAMHRALVDLARDHAQDCCSYLYDKRPTTAWKGTR